MRCQFILPVYLTKKINNQQERGSIFLCLGFFILFEEFYLYLLIVQLAR